MIIEKRYQVFTCSECGERHEMGVVAGAISERFGCKKCGHKIYYATDSTK